MIYILFGCLSLYVRPVICCAGCRLCTKCQLCLAPWMFAWFSSLHLHTPDVYTPSGGPEKALRPPGRGASSWAASSRQPRYTHLIHVHDFWILPCSSLRQPGRFFVNVFIFVLVTSLFSLRSENGAHEDSNHTTLQNAEREVVCTRINDLVID